jgi:hypothetical protein
MVKIAKAHRRDRFNTHQCPKAGIEPAIEEAVQIQKIDVESDQPPCAEISARASVQPSGSVRKRIIGQVDLV